jgi:uncharacterized protein (DUF2141 family)
MSAIRGLSSRVIVAVLIGLGAGVAGGAQAYASGAPGSSSAGERTSLTVRLEGVQGSDGVLRISLFRTPDGFPERSELADRTASVEPSGPTADVEFHDVAVGDWAIAVLHDENRNEKLDRNFLGIPKEGVGASNDAVRFGLPKFENARFQLPADGTKVAVRLKYWL